MLNKRELILKGGSLMVVDPVCSKEVDEKAAPGGKARFWGKVFYFCEASCRSSFQRDPQKYVPESGDEKEPGYDPRMFIGDM
jgi:YHS domain-containing protein